MNFTNINVPVLMTVNPSPSYRVTENYCFASKTWTVTAMR